MKKYLFLFYFISHFYLAVAQDFSVQVNQSVDNNELVLDFMVIRHSPTPFAFRSSNFSIYLNNSALNLAGKYIDHAFDGLWDNDANASDYFDLTVGNGPNYITFNVNSIVSSVGSGSIVPTTLTRMGRVRIPITDPSACNSYTWRLVPMAVRDWNGVNIKPTGNWIDSPTCISLCNPCTFAVSDASTSNDIPNCLAKDLSGNYYIGGSKDNLGFINKYNPAGVLIWSKNYGSQVKGLVINSLGNAVITGSFKASTPIIGLSFSPNSTTNSTDAFIIQLDNDGNIIQARNFGGRSIDEGSALAQDAAGNLYITGIYNLTVDFDPNIGITNRTSAGLRDIYVLKLNSLLDFQWVFTAGSLSTDWSNAIAVSNDGVWITGQFSGTMLGMISNNSYDGFVTKLDLNTGNVLLTEPFGNSGSEDKGNAIVADIAGNVYVAANFQGNVYGQTANGVNADVLLFSLDASGGFRWSARGGGGGKDVCNSLSIQGNEIIATGFVRSTTGLFTGAASIVTGTLGTNEIFVTKYSESGNFICLRLMGGAGEQEGRAILFDGVNYILAGSNSGSFSAEADDFSSVLLTATGNYDGFLMLGKHCAAGAMKMSNSNEDFTLIDELSSQVKIYPQPAYHELNISELPEGSKVITLLDLSGKKLLQFETQLNQINFDISNIAKGIYLLDIQCNNTRVVQKLIKE